MSLIATARQFWFVPLYCCNRPCQSLVDEVAVQECLLAALRRKKRLSLSRLEKRLDQPVEEIYRVRDRVAWTREGPDGPRTRFGVVVEVVLSGARPSRARFPAMHSRVATGYPQKTVSYLVRSGGRFFLLSAVALRHASSLEVAGMIL